jgi:hypothetical protein
MKRWRVIGVDSTTGKGRSIIVEGATDREAQERANDMGILVERIDPAQIEQSQITPPPENQPPKHHPAEDVDNTAEHQPQTPTLKPRLVATMKGLVEAKQVDEEAKEKRRLKREMRGPDNPFSSEANNFRLSGNRIAEIAAGVFLGMLLLSCLSPCLVYGIIAFLAELGRQNPITP